MSRVTKRKARRKRIDVKVRKRVAKKAVRDVDDVLAQLAAGIGPLEWLTMSENTKNLWRMRTKMAMADLEI